MPIPIADAAVILDAARGETDGTTMSERTESIGFFACTRRRWCMCRLGADVVKVEPPDGDVTR